MYLSRLKLNPRHRRVQSELARPYELHRTVMAAFPAILPPDERVLFRVDTDARSGQLALLVQSQYAPDWSHVQREPGYLLPGTAPEVKEVHLPLMSGQVLAFRLRANPTVKKKSHRDSKELPVNGVRLGLAKEEEQRAWLERKGEQHGFRVLWAQIIPEGMQVSYSGRGAGARRLAHLAVRFEGLLQVADAEVFRQAVRDGIGSAKAFGFGLLSLARPTR
ncbi:MAG: type I-E CRISPR-associated protein Cas6/Cse3/CasE [Chloroflexi bacterium]|nr:type I-E CRISPR-associated protein Cas6/Cse3/CasE [Chloroflexota bacterium]